MTRDTDHSASWTLLADTLDPIAPPPVARDAFVAEIRGRRRFAPFVGEISTIFDVDRDATLAALARVDDAAAWRPGLLPGSRYLPFEGRRGAHLMLARIPAGTRIPRHTHTARERTYVLQGTLIEDGQRRHASGELIDMRPGSEHDLAAGDDECLVVFEQEFTDSRDGAS